MTPQIQTWKSEAYYWPSKKLRQVEVEEKIDIAMYSRNMHPTMFLDLMHGKKVRNDLVNES